MHSLRTSTRTTAWFGESLEEGDENGGIEEDDRGGEEEEEDSKERSTCYLWKIGIGEQEDHSGDDHDHGHLDGRNPTQRPEVRLVDLWVWWKAHRGPEVPSVEQFYALQYLTLSNAGLESLPSEIGSLPNVRCLDLHGNRLRQLPTEIGKLCRLYDLDLSENDLTALPTHIGNLRCLSDLTLTSNYLRCLPEEIGKLHQLQDLWFSDNLLEDLPRSIGQLKKVIHAGLRHNRLRSLPLEFGELTNLRVLYLNGNRLRSLPDTMVNMKRLCLLNLYRNRLRRIPNVVSCLPALTHLDVGENPISVMPFPMTTFFSRIGCHFTSTHCPWKSPEKAIWVRCSHQPHQIHQWLLWEHHRYTWLTIIFLLCRGRAKMQRRRAAFPLDVFLQWLPWKVKMTVLSRVSCSLR